MMFFKKIGIFVATMILIQFPSPSIASEKLSPWIKCQLDSAIQECFVEYEQDQIKIKPLTGGYNATSMLLEVADKRYVLRITKESESPLRVNAELHATEYAAAMGIAPAIHWVGANGRVIVMDYIAGGTLSDKRSKKYEVLVDVAKTMRKVHTLPKNPYQALSFEERMEKFYQDYSQIANNLSVFDPAIAIIREVAVMLQNLESPFCNTHGDLNPRNILDSSEKIYFIDWCEGMYTDPFHDLAYYSILMNYNTDEESLLLQNYLERDPFPEEYVRYLIAKKMNFARLALGTQNIGNKLCSENEAKNPSQQPLKEWLYYINSFANGNEVLSPSFFWEFARAALKKADTIKI